MLRQRSGQEYKSVSKTFNDFRDKCGTTRTFPRADFLAKLNNWGRRALIRAVTGNLIATATDMGESVRRTTISHSLCGTVARWMLLLSKRHMAGTQKTLKNDEKSAHNLRHDNDLKHTGMTMPQWLWDESQYVLEWASQNPNLNRIEHLWRDLNMVVHR